MPAASRSQSSHAQPCSCTSGARNSDASATRPVITMSAPCASASTIGRAPRYADANSGGPGNVVERRAGVEVRERLAVLGVQRVEPSEHVVADDGRDRDAA